MDENTIETGIRVKQERGPDENASWTKKLQIPDPKSKLPSQILVPPRRATSRNFTASQTVRLTPGHNCLLRLKDR